MFSFHDIDKYEKYFSKNDYIGDKDVERKIECLKGKIPVLIMSPFALKQEIGLDIMSPETFTGGTNILLHHLTNCHSLYPNHHLVENDISEFYQRFHSMINEISSSNNLNLIMEIRKVKSDNIYKDIDIFVKGCSKEIIDKIKEIFYSYGFLNISTNQLVSFYPMISEHITLTEFDSIPSIQLNVYSNLLNPINDYMKYHFLVNAIIEIIHVFNVK